MKNLNGMDETKGLAGLSMGRMAGKEICPA